MHPIFLASASEVPPFTNCCKVDVVQPNRLLIPIRTFPLIKSSRVEVVTSILEARVIKLICSNEGVQLRFWKRVALDA